MINLPLVGPRKSCVRSVKLFMKLDAWGVKSRLTENRLTVLYYWYSWLIPSHTRLTFYIEFWKEMKLKKSFACCCELWGWMKREGEKKKKVKWFARKWKVFLLADEDEGEEVGEDEEESKMWMFRSIFTLGLPSTSLLSLFLDSSLGWKWKYKPWPFGEIFFSDIIESLFSAGILSAKT